MNPERAKELLICAVECDKVGRILEAQNLYEDGIEELMKFVEIETDDEKRRRYLERVKEYMDRAETIRSRINGHLQKGEIEERIVIDEDSTGHDYDKLFSKYMNASTREILLEEPYIRENYQFINLVRFMEVAVTNCPNLKYVSVITKEDPKNVNLQRTNMSQIQSDLLSRSIRMEIKYDENLHDRKFVLSNGFIITIGRGLHFFKPTNPLYSLGIGNYKFRKCLKTEITICRTKSNQ